MFLYGNIAGIAGWWQYVAANGMDQFALTSLQAFVGALSAAYMMRKDDDKPGTRRKRPAPEGQARRTIEQELAQKRQERMHDRFSSSATRFDPPGLTPLREEPAPAHTPREPRFPAVEPMNPPSAWGAFEPDKTLPIPPMRGEETIK